MRSLLSLSLSLVGILHAFIPTVVRMSGPSRIRRQESDWKGDFDGLEDDDGYEFARLFQERVAPIDRSGIRVRQFCLGGTRLFG